MCVLERKTAIFWLIMHCSAFTLSRVAMLFQYLLDGLKVKHTKFCMYPLYVPTLASLGEEWDLKKYLLNHSSFMVTYTQIG